MLRKNVALMKKIILLFAAVLAAACEIVDNDMDKHVDSTYVSLADVAALMSRLPLEAEHLREVHDAVSASSGNGYDEEYTMSQLFTAPGSGVGDPATKASAGYERPLHMLIEEHLRAAPVTKSASEIDPDRWISYVSGSDIQIYWPYSEVWDGECMPVITFDPEDNSVNNIGYRLVTDEDGFRHVEEVLVDEELARRCPVWVINRNSDAKYKSLEMLRREDPMWGEGGGSVIVRPADTKSPSEVRTLILKNFTMNRNYDSWFAGASEFFVKIGAFEDFTATTEAEMKLYNPTITDFMIVVKRNQVGIPQPFNAVLVSDWTGQMDSCAMMIIEDDGGTIREWNCTALVRVESKSYGIELKIPFYSYDDIVWRGNLSSRWFEANSNTVGHFGDVDLTFELMEY